ncbi:polyketide synthase, partial [Salmonella enterica subsp. enterica serovar Typhi]|nr:polyketide synthase [Salmonella enterica subsp. enterica serovar Typhi]
MNSYRKELNALLGIEQKKATSHENISGTEVKEMPDQIVGKSIRARFMKQQVTNVMDDEEIDIAIVGISGKYPQAANVSEYWSNLRSGKDCISEIPKNRWDYTPYYDEDKNKKGKIYSKWGGFIEGMKQFDPLFFNISPKEAERMDPQERLFLTSVYELLEDAGYTPEELRRNSSIL